MNPYRSNVSDMYAVARRERAAMRHVRVFSLRNLLRAILLAVFRRVNARTAAPAMLPDAPPPKIVAPPADLFREHCLRCGAHYEYTLSHVKYGDTRCPACGYRNIHVSSLRVPPGDTR